MKKLTHIADPSTRELLLIISLVFGGLALLIYWPVLVGKTPFPVDIIQFFPPWQSGSAVAYGRHAELGDLVTMMYPWRTFAAHAIRHFKLPLWNDHLLAGTPFIANAVSAVFYPVNFLYYVLPIHIAWSLRLMLMVLLAGSFMSAFVRSIGGSLTGSLAAGVVYSFCGYMSAWDGWPHSDAAVWLPLMLFSIQKLARQPSFGFVVLTAFSFAMPVLAGHPETAIHVTVAATAFAIVRVWQTRSLKPDSYIKLLLLLVLAAILSVGISSAQLIPTGEWVQGLTHRPDLIWPSAHFDQMIGLFSRDNRGDPNSAGVNIPESASYAGMLTLVLIFVAPLNRNKRDTLFFFLLAAISIQLIFGWGPLSWLAKHTPVLQGLRHSRLWILVDFSLAVLAGLGLSSLESLEQNTRKTINACILIGVGIALAAVGTYALFQHTRTAQDWIRSPQSSAALLAIAVVLLVLRLRGWLSRQQFGFAAILVLSIDLMSFAYGHIPFSDSAQIFPPSPAMDFLRAHDPEHYRVAELDTAYGSNFEMMYGLSSPAGYELTSRRSQAFLRDFSSAALDGVFLRSDQVGAILDRRLDLMNVKYLITSDDPKCIEALSNQSGRFSLVYSRGTVRIFENKMVLPRAFLVPAFDARVMPVESEQLTELSNAAFDPAQAVLLFQPVDRFAGKETMWTRSAVNSIKQGLNELIVDAEAKVPSILVFSQTSYPGWTVSVDNQPAKLLRVDYNLTGLALAAGPHHIELRFEPASVRMGIGISLFTIFSLLAGSFVFAYRRGTFPKPTRWLIPIPAAIAVACIVMALTTFSDVAADRTVAPTVSADSLRIDTSPTLVRFENAPELLTGSAHIDAHSDAVTVGGFSMVVYGPAEAVIPASEPGNTFVVPISSIPNSRTGLAIANSATKSTTVSFSFPGGEKGGSLTIPPSGQLSVFVDEPPFNVRPFSNTGTIVLKSAERIAVSAVLIGGESAPGPMMAGIPVADARARYEGTIYLPFLASNGSAELMLTNPSGSVIRGRQRYFDVSGHLRSDQPYTLSPEAAAEYRTPMLPESGFVEIVPDVLSSPPNAAIILFSIANNKISALSSIYGQNGNTNAEIYLDGSQSAETSLLISNPGREVAKVRIATKSWTREISIPPVASINQAFGLSRGVILNVNSSTPIATTGIKRKVINGTWTILSTIPPLSFSKDIAVLPSITVGQWFSTRLVVFASIPGKGARLSLFDQLGRPMKLRISPF